MGYPCCNDPPPECIDVTLSGLAAGTCANAALYNTTYRLARQPTGGDWQHPRYSGIVPRYDHCIDGGFTLDAYYEHRTVEDQTHHIFVLAFGTLLRWELDVGVEKPVFTGRPFAASEELAFVETEFTTDKIDAAASVAVAAAASDEPDCYSVPQVCPGCLADTVGAEIEITIAAVTGRNAALNGTWVLSPGHILQDAMGFWFESYTPTTTTQHPCRWAFLSDDRTMALEVRLDVSPPGLNIYHLGTLNGLAFIDLSDTFVNPPSDCTSASGSGNGPEYYSDANPWTWHLAMSAGA